MALVAASLIIAAEGFVVFSVPRTVDVTGISIASPDNVCGLDRATTSGFVANVTEVIGLELAVSGNATAGGGTAPCVVTSVMSATMGFAVRSANVPLSIPANSTSTLIMNVTCPASAFTGTLTLSLT